MATFRFEVNNKPTKNKTYNILLCITVDRKRKRLKTSVDLKRRSDFNTQAKQDNWIRPCEPSYKAWNATLAAELERAKQKYRGLRDDGIASSEKIASELVAGERTTSFLQYAKERTQEILNAGGLSNWKKYNGFINKLEEFLTGVNGRTRDLSFGELTPGLLSKFETYLHSLTNQRAPERKLHPNTVAVNLTIFKTLVNRASQIEKYISPEKNPFLVYNYKVVKTEKEKLNTDEIAAISALELKPNTPIWHCRNYFLFSFYCAGIRAGDFIQLRRCNITSEGRLRYQMGKNHKVRDFKLPPQAKDILALYDKEDAKPTDYIFPLLDPSAAYAAAITQEDKDTLPTELKQKLFNQISAKNAYINKYLGQLRNEAKIAKNISFHIARHSFAKLAKQKGIDNAQLKELLAHSSLRTTEGYMGNFDTADNDRALETMFAQPEDDLRAKLQARVDSLTPDQIAILLKKLEE